MAAGVCGVPPLPGWVVRFVGVDLPEEQIQRILGTAGQALSRWTPGDEGGIAFDMPAHIVTGCAG